MELRTEWVSGAENASREERATVCDLRMFVGGRNVCRFFDAELEETYDGVVVPSVHLAEGLAADWWSIFGGRDRAHSILGYRNGFALPDVAFRFDGSTFSVEAARSDCANPKLSFRNAGRERLSRADAEAALSDFVDRTVAKLSEKGIEDSEVALAWARVSASRADPDEQAFCEAAGALGADPYAIAENEARLIEQMDGLFSGETLVEFLAGVGDNRRGENFVEWVEQAESRPAGNSLLPRLRGIAELVGAAARRRLGEAPWTTGYRAARAVRLAEGRRNGAWTRTGIAESLGAGNFENAAAIEHVLALVSRENDGVHVHLADRGVSAENRKAENFAFGRAIGDAVCFSDTRRSVVNNLGHAERQAVGRAFAAEFLAPVEDVLRMSQDGLEVDEIADEFDVAPLTIQHQIENRDRIGQACAELG